MRRTLRLLSFLLALLSKPAGSPARLPPPHRALAGGRVKDPLSPSQTPSQSSTLGSGAGEMSNERLWGQCRHGQRRPTKNDSRSAQEGFRVFWLLLRHRRGRSRWGQTEWPGIRLGGAGLPRGWRARRPSYSCSGQASARATAAWRLSGLQPSELDSTPSLGRRNKGALLPALSSQLRFLALPLVLAQPPSGSLCCGPAPAGSQAFLEGLFVCEDPGSGEAACGMPGWNF